jgi:two-component system nitrogen regulation response regulator GlnG
MRILFADDEVQIRALALAILEEQGFQVVCAEDGSEAVDLFGRSRPDVVVVDLKMPNVDGIGVLKHVKDASPETPVIIITGHGDIAIAVETMKLGAYDFISKPFHMDDLLATVRRAAERTQLLAQVEQLKRDVRHQTSLLELMGHSALVQDLITQVDQVARSNFSVLLQGETGTGKELIARAIHRHSSRQNSPMIAIDCGAIPETLIESELFGYEKGAFTGADRRKDGSFAAADGGTIFLDEIANLPLATQGKLLRVLQERHVQPLGSTKPHPVDVRLIAASNISLEKEVRAGRFRQDLYYRLNEFIISAPALRDRREDIAHLARRFLEEARVELGGPARTFSDEALRALAAHDWPGNVRELRNVIRRAALVGHAIVGTEHLRLNEKESEAEPTSAPPLPTELPSLRTFVAQAVAEAEERLIRQALRIAAGNKAHAARMLATDYKTLLGKIKRYAIGDRDRPDKKDTELRSS